MTMTVDRTLLLQLLVNQIVSVGLPILVALVTTKWASGLLKATTLALLSAATGLLNEALVAGLADFDWVTGGLLAFFAWMGAVATHLGYNRPSGLADNVIDATARFGVGSKPGRPYESGREPAA